MVRPRALRGDLPRIGALLAALAAAALVAGAFLRWSGGAAAVTTASITFRPVADSYVNHDFPTTNYGTSTQVRVDDPTDTQNTYLRFDPEGLSGAVTQATRGCPRRPQALPRWDMNRWKTDGGRGSSGVHRGASADGRAHFIRRQGIRYLIRAYDVHRDYLRARLRPTRNGASTLVFMEMIRLAYPRRRRIYWIQDNLSCHWTPDIRAWPDEHNVELVPTPTTPAT